MAIKTVSERRRHQQGLRAMKQAAKIFAKMSPEDVTRFVAKYGEDTPPHEIGKRIGREMVAMEVREKIAADIASGLLPPGMPLDDINEYTVVEFLEGMVEGDDVLNDAATHQWFRKRLDQYRDTEIKLDESADEQVAFATAINLAQALADFDVLVEQKGNDLAIFANTAARAVLGESALWCDLPFVPEFSGWKALEGHLSSGAHGDIAKVVVERWPALRVGTIGTFGRVEPHAKAA